MTITKEYQEYQIRLQVAQNSFDANPNKKTATALSQLRDNFNNIPQKYVGGYLSMSDRNLINKMESIMKVM